MKRMLFEIKNNKLFIRLYAKNYKFDNGALVLVLGKPEMYNASEASGTRQEIMKMKDGELSVYLDGYNDHFYGVQTLCYGGDEIAVPANTNLKNVKFNTFFKTLYFKYTTRVRTKKMVEEDLSKYDS